MHAQSCGGWGDPCSCVHSLIPHPGALSGNPPPPGDVILKVATAQPGAWARRFLYYLSMIKIAVTLAKYVPQVLLNRRRRSTSGFSIAQARRQAVRLQPNLFCFHLPCANTASEPCCCLEQMGRRRCGGRLRAVSRVPGAVTRGAPSRAGAVRLCGRVAVPVPAVS